MIIYKITNLVNNKIYIGQTIQKLNSRINQHFNDKNRYTHYFAKALKKYNKECWKWEIIYTANSIDELNEKETFFIEFYNSINPEIGYNGNNGGNNRTPTEYTRNKLRISHLGYKPTDEQRRKIGEKAKNRKHTKESKLKMSLYQKEHIWNKNKKLSQEHKNKISNTMKGKKKTQEHINKVAAKVNRKQIIDINTGIIYNSIVDTISNLKIGRTTIVRHITNKTKNPRFQYYKLLSSPA